MTAGSGREEFAAYVGREFQPLVRRWSRAVDGVTADAEDLVQDSMVALARQWQDVGSVDGWMHRVCQRGAARVVRRRQHPVRGARSLDEVYADSLPAEPENPAAESDAYRLARELVTGPLEWEILTLHAEGCPQAEIAEAVRDHPGWHRRRMTCTTANVGTLLRREKERLAQEIGSRLKSPGPDAPAFHVNRILRTILRLPAKQREVFLLRLLTFEPCEIAEIMGSRPGTARVNLSHANKKLAEEFGTPVGTPTARTRLLLGLGPFGLVFLTGAVFPHKERVLAALGAVPEFESLESALRHMGIAMAYELGRRAAASADPAAASDDPLSLFTAVTRQEFADYIIRTFEQKSDHIRELVHARGGIDQAMKILPRALGLPAAA